MVISTFDVQRELLPVGLGAASRIGSTASVWQALVRVRYTFNSERIADVAAGLFRANNCREQPQ
jgi:hypothetical protein